MTDARQISLFDDLSGGTGDTRDSWGTDPMLYRKLDSEFHFVLDLAASAGNAKADAFITEEQDALSIAWHLLDADGSMFLNPPFSRMAIFMQKVSLEIDLCKHPIVVVSPGHRHEQQWFHDFVIGRAAEVRCPKGRINYVNPPGIKGDSARFPSFVYVYRPGFEGDTIIRSL